jgi:hypothetical protein
MIGVARRVAPSSPERWDDMAQVGYQTWVACAKKYDPSHGVPIRLFLLPIVRHEMRRFHRREIAHSMGDTPYRVMRGEAVVNRTTVETEDNPDGLDSLSDETCATPEDAVIRYHEERRARVALWKAAAEMGVPYNQWRNAYFRDCLLSGRVRRKDIQDRYDLHAGSCHYFKSRLVERARELVS